ncbi:MAG: gamma-glutamyl-gamma-aminobutyrate hydrolase family protein [Candidatus Aminicenantes bacterium]|jgi:putative glutamine amidotransferase
MKKTDFLRVLIFLCVSLILSPFTLVFAQDPYFHSAEKDNDRVVVAILHPAPFVIESLMELKKQELLSPKGLVVVGILHEKQMTDFEKAKTQVEEKNIDWIKFHTIKGTIDVHSLFQKNEMTAEFKTIFENADGLIFFGGADIPPYVYGEKTRLLTSIHTPYRHFLEVSFIFHLFGGLQNPGFVGLMESAPKFPVLCICLGAQSLNVGTGGTLIQDIQSQLYGRNFIEDVIHSEQNDWHRNPYSRIHPELKLYPYLLHPIVLCKGGKFTAELGFRERDRPLVISAHHQAFGKLGKGIKTNATSADGRVVEGIEHEKYPNVLGVQFHPDFPELWNTDYTFKWTPEDTEEVSFLSLLKKNPPSLEFNKKIWAWFFGQVKTHHTAKQEKRNIRDKR